MYRLRQGSYKIKPKFIIEKGSSAELPCAMLRVALRAAPVARRSLATRALASKASTGIVGLDVQPEAKTILESLYSKTLTELQVGGLFCAGPDHHLALPLPPFPRWTASDGEGLKCPI